MSNFQEKGIQVTQQSKQSWIAILAFICFSLLLILAGAGKILNLAFPVGAFAIGMFLYVREPLLFVGFNWWLWFLTPLIRRLADWKSGFTEPSPILLAPYLVTLVTFFTLWEHFPKIHRQGGLPFLFSFIGVFYGFFVGLIYRSPIQVILALLEWLIPLLFGFYLFVNWQNYPSYRQNIQRVFLWGVLVMGVYGIIQFLVLPEWDRSWLINANFASGGQPYALLINVWSTMNANRPFGTVMMAGLLLLFVNDRKGVLGIPATIAGYIAFLLTKKRTTWLSWLLGLFAMINSLKPYIQMRIIVTIMLTIILVIPLTTIEPFSDVIYSRFETFSNLEEDNSGDARQETYNQYLGEALTSWTGEGLGGPSHDSAILSTLLNLGWLGTFPYMGGILLSFFSLFQGSESRFDPFAAVARAIAFASLSQIPLGNPFAAVQGVILWGFTGIGMAAQRYYQYQNNNQKNEINNTII